MINYLHKKYSHHQELANNIFWRSVQIFCRQGTGFIIFFFCAKLLTTYELGLYSYAFAIVNLVGLFSDFGISSATSRFVAKYQAIDKEKIRLVIFNSGLIVLSLTILISLGVILLGPRYLGDKYIYVIYCLPLILIFPFIALYDGIYRGLKKFKLLSQISVGVSLIFIGTIYFFIKRYGLTGAFAAQDIYYAILLVCFIIGYLDLGWKIDRKIIKEIVSYAIIIGLCGVGYYLFTRVNIVILGQLNLIKEISYYEVVNKVILTLLIPFTILAQVAAPNITNLFAKKEYEKLIGKYKKYMLFTFISGFITISGVYVFFPILVKYWLNKYYLPEIMLIMNLTLPIFLLECMNTVAAISFSTSTGHAKINMIINILFGILNIPLAIFMIETYGFIGAAYAALLVRISADLIFMIYYYFVLKKLSNKAL